MAVKRPARQQQRFKLRYAARGRRIYYEDADVARKDEAVLAAYRETVGMPVIARRARALSRFALSVRIDPAPDDLLLGIQTFNRGFLTAAAAEEADRLGYAVTSGHIVHDYQTLLRRGAGGLLDDLADAARRGGSADSVEAYAEELRDAQADPAAHADLIVRVSGYSARFITVDKHWQDALIARAEQGMQAARICGATTCGSRAQGRRSS
jgi:hypothetical protein